MSIWAVKSPNFYFYFFPIVPFDFGVRGGSGGLVTSLWRFVCLVPRQGVGGCGLAGKKTRVSKTQ